MKNTFRFMLASYRTGVKLNLKSGCKSFGAAYQCRVDVRCASNGTKIHNSDEEYFKNLSNVIHQKKDVTIHSFDTRDNSQIKVVRKELKHEDIYEEDEEVFDSLAEKQLKSHDVIKLTESSFNLAAYVDKSETLQQLVKLGVNLSVWDGMEDVRSYILTLDFEKDIKKYITFLHDVGVAANDLGRFLSKNPKILKMRIDDLQVRINYLESKKFSAEAIGRIVSKAPHYLLFSTQAIDRRLGYLQKEYKLSGDDVRSVISRSPKLATWNFIKLRDKHFSLKEEMGFNQDEIKTLLLNKPKIWLLEQKSLLERFNYIHSTMKIPHSLIVNFPGCLTHRRFDVKQRHLFLLALERAQYDPSKECYVSLKALVGGTDHEFCTEVAKSSVKKYNEFLKTL